MEDQINKNNQEPIPQETNQERSFGEMRRLRKRARIKRDISAQLALPVKVLWDLASEAEKTLAHKTAVALMEYWTGRLTKQETAENLGLPQLRVWQLSQQALAGMVVGLLKQPRCRLENKEEALMKMEKGEKAADPRMLQKKIEELERVIATQNSLIAILREMPGCKQVKLKKSQLPKTNTVPPQTPQSQAVSSQSPIKRKRGRPRKNPELQNTEAVAVQQQAARQSTRGSNQIVSPTASPAMPTAAAPTTTTVQPGTHHEGGFMAGNSAKTESNETG